MVPNILVKLYSYQMLRSIAYIHALGICHRDIKPQNILLEKDEGFQSKIYLVDFGLSKQFLNDKGRHIKFSVYDDMVGTAIFASLNAHQGYEVSRRDDLESFAYSFIYLYFGTLPWKYSKHKDK